MDYEEVDNHWSEMAAKYQDDRAGAQTDDINFLKYRDACEKERFLNLISGYPTNRVLEVGCGTGRWCNWLTKYYDNVVGIDASKEMLAIAKHNAPENVEYYQARAEDFCDGSYDLIYFSSVLQYLEDQDVIKALSNARKMSKVIITRDTLGESLQSSYPVIYRSRHELDNLIEQAGLTIVSSCSAYELPQRARMFLKFFPCIDVKWWTDRTAFIESLLVAFKGKYQTNLQFTVMKS